MSEQPFPSAQIIALLFRKKWIIVAVSIVAAVGAYAYALTLPSYFRSTVNCVPPKADQSALGGALGGLSSTLKDIGLTKMTGKSGDAYDFIVILYARSLRDSMIKRFDLVSEYKLEKATAQEQRDEFEGNLEINLHNEGNYEITIYDQDPVKAAEMCTTFVSYANALSNRIAREEAVKATAYLENRMRLMDSTMFALADSLSAYSKKYMMFSPLDQAKASATAITEVQANIMKQETILGLLEANYGASDPQVQAQRSMVAGLRTQFQDMQNKPGFAGNFALSDAAGVGARYMKMYAEYEASMKVKAFMMPTLEQMRLDQQKSAPSLLVVDPPLVSEKKARPRRSLIAAGTGVGAGILSVLIILLSFAYRTLKAQINS
jgi:capsule polysaccharide export protein KpsE/RkpR